MRRSVVHRSWKSSIIPVAWRVFTSNQSRETKRAQLPIISTEMKAASSGQKPNRSIAPERPTEKCVRDDPLAIHLSPWDSFVPGQKQGKPLALPERPTTVVEPKTAAIREFATPLKSMPFDGSGVRLSREQTARILSMNRQEVLQLRDLTTKLLHPLVVNEIWHDALTCPVPRDGRDVFFENLRAELVRILGGDVAIPEQITALLAARNRLPIAQAELDIAQAHQNSIQGVSKEPASREPSPERTADLVSTDRVDLASLDASGVGAFVKATFGSFSKDEARRAFLDKRAEIDWSRYDRRSRSADGSISPARALYEWNVAIDASRTLLKQVKAMTDALTQRIQRYMPESLNPFPEFVDAHPGIKDADKVVGFYLGKIHTLDAASDTLGPDGLLAAREMLGRSDPRLVCVGESPSNPHAARTFLKEAVAILQSMDEAYREGSPVKMPVDTSLTKTELSWRIPVPDAEVLGQVEHFRAETQRWSGVFDQAWEQEEVAQARAHTPEQVTDQSRGWIREKYEDLRSLATLFQEDADGTAKVEISNADRWAIERKFVVKVMPSGFGLPKQRLESALAGAWCALATGDRIENGTYELRDLLPRMKLGLERRLENVGAPVESPSPQPIVSISESEVLEHVVGALRREVTRLEESLGHPLRRAFPSAPVRPSAAGEEAATVPKAVLEVEKTVHDWCRSYRSDAPSRIGAAEAFVEVTDGVLNPEQVALLFVEKAVLEVLDGGRGGHRAILEAGEQFDLFREQFREVRASGLIAVQLYNSVLLSNLGSDESEAMVKGLSTYQGFYSSLPFSLRKKGVFEQMEGLVADYGERVEQPSRMPLPDMTQALQFFDHLRAVANERTTATLMKREMNTLPPPDKKSWEPICLPWAQYSGGLAAFNEQVGSSKRSVDNARQSAETAIATALQKHAASVLAKEQETATARDQANLALHAIANLRTELNQVYLPRPTPILLSAEGSDRSARFQVDPAGQAEVAQLATLVVRKRMEIYRESRGLSPNPNIIATDDEVFGRFSRVMAEQVTKALEHEDALEPATARMLADGVIVTSLADLFETAEAHWKSRVRDLETDWNAPFAYRNPDASSS
jgi:hypothetical protein